MRVTYRLHLAEAASNQEIEQQLAQPWSEEQVGDAFAATLAAWKARSKSKRMKGIYMLDILGSNTQTPCWRLVLQNYAVKFL